jgi:mono/diheme cytochrome c family protein
MGTEMSDHNKTITRSWTLFAVAVLLAGLVAAPSRSEEPLRFIGFDGLSPAAHDGLKEIFSGRCFHSGIPVKALELLSQAPGQLPESLTYDPASQSGQFLSTDQIPSPHGRDTNLPLGQSQFDRNGTTLIGMNCFQCHAGMAHGNVVAGLGNHRVQPPAGPVNPEAGKLMEKISAQLATETERQEFAEFLANTNVQLNIPATASRGDNFGPFVVWSLAAHLEDPARTGLRTSNKATELVKLMQTTPLPNVDPMPWWLLKYKEKNYWYADGGIKDAAHFSFNFTMPHLDVNENHAAHVESTRKALVFARETQSPIYPAALDAGRVRRGADLFHGRVKPKNRQGFQTCANCHGTYTKKDCSADLSVPGSWEVDYQHSHRMRNVKTDETYNQTLQTIRPVADRTKPLVEYYAKQGTPELTPIFSVPSRVGYIAPPLVGIWTSAPYFHNGSVPTVEAVLNSKIRPEIWRRQLRDPYAYDLDRLGLIYQPLTRSQYKASAENAANSHPMSEIALDHGATYDAASFGHGNMGHTFGDSLTSEERSAVIEFLKSLSGPDMPPVKANLTGR